jgi:hypothetical protein
MPSRSACLSGKLPSALSRNGAKSSRQLDVNLRCRQSSFHHNLVDGAALGTRRLAMIIWLVRWLYEGEWIEAFTTEELAEAHAWAIVRSISDAPDSLPEDLDEAVEEVAAGADLIIETIILKDAPLNPSAYK